MEKEGEKGDARLAGGSSEERGTRKAVLGSCVNVVTVRSRLLTWLRPLRFFVCRADIIRSCDNEAVAVAVVANDGV